MNDTAAVEEQQPGGCPRSSGRVRALVGLCAATLLLLASTSSVDAADLASERADVSERTVVPDDWRTEETENGWALPIEQLGWGATLVATNEDATFDLTIPYVAGHRVDSIEFTASLSPGVPEGHVIVTVGDEEVSTTLVEGDQPVPIRVDLPTMEPGSAVSLRIHPHHDRCPIGAEATIGRLATPTFFFRSRPVSARTDDDRLRTPDVVAGVQFIVDETHAEAVEQGVLSSTAAFARRFPGEQRFSVVSDDEPLGSAPPFVTRVRITERDEAAISGDPGNRQFLLSGRADQLVTHAIGLVDALDTLDEIDRVTVSADGDDADDVDSDRARRSISELTSRLRVAGAHHLELPVQLEQAHFGRPVASYRARLGGVVSPTRSADASGIQLSLWTDDEMLEVIELDENGRFDLETVIAGDRVGRTTVVRLVLDLQVDGCPAGDSLGIQLDRGSWVEADFGQGLEPGFRRFPQVFGPRLAVDTGSTVHQLGVAADAVGMLQDATTYPLDPVVVERSSVAEGGPALVVGADIELLDVLDAPVNGPSGRIETGQTTLASTTDDVAVMQAFVSADDSDVLVIDDVPGASFFGLPDELSVHRFRQLGGTVAHLDPEGVIEVAGISIDSTDDPSADDHEDVALASLHADGGARAGPAATSRRQLFALGLAATLFVAGLAVFGRRSVRAAARVNTANR